MIAIQTKYIGPSNTKGSRIKAWTCTGKSAYISYPHEYSHEMAYFQAVKALIKKYDLDWDMANMRYGSTDNGYVFCFDHAKVEI